MEEREKKKVREVRNFISPSIQFSRTTKLTVIAVYSLVTKKSLLLVCSAGTLTISPFPQRQWRLGFHKLIDSKGKFLFLASSGLFH